MLSAVFFFSPFTLWPIMDEVHEILCMFDLSFCELIPLHSTIPKKCQAQPISGNSKFPPPPPPPPHPPPHPLYLSPPPPSLPLLTQETPLPFPPPPIPITPQSTTNTIPLNTHSHFSTFTTFRYAFAAQPPPFPLSTTPPRNGHSGGKEKYRPSIEKEITTPGQEPASSPPPPLPHLSAHLKTPQHHAFNLLFTAFRGRCVPPPLPCPSSGPLPGPASIDLGAPIYRRYGPRPERPPFSGVTLLPLPLYSIGSVARNPPPPAGLSHCFAAPGSFPNLHLNLPGNTVFRPLL